MAVRGALFALVSASLTFTSSAASAAPNATQQVNPWAVLTALSDGAPAAAMCGSATTAAAHADQQPQDRNGCVLPVMDVPATSAALPRGSALSPLLVGLIAIASAAGIYLAFNAGNHPNSPV